MVIFKELNNFIKAEGLNKVNLERFQSLFCFNIRFDLLFPITTWWITAVARSLILPVLSVEQNVFKLWLKIYGGTQWRSWYRNCATSWEVAGSIPDVINLYKKWVPEYCLGRGGGRECWQLYHHHVPIVSESGSLSLLEYSGPAIDLHRNCFTFFKHLFISKGYFIFISSMVGFLRPISIFGI
jgi:hypothetical protein